MAIHSNIVTWRIQQTEAWWATVHGITKLDTTEWLTLLHFQFWIMRNISLSFNKYLLNTGYVLHSTTCWFTVVNKLDMSTSHMESTCVQCFRWVILLYSLLRLRFMILLKGKHLVVKIRKYTLTPKINRGV